MLLLLAFGCNGEDSATAPDGWTRRVGMIEPSLSGTQTLTLPERAAAGVEFTAVVRTLGSSSCTRIASTRVVVSGLNVDITPYDEYAPAHLMCTEDIHAFEHVAKITVPIAGLAHVTVHGRGLDGRTLTYEETITVTLES